MRCFLLMMVRGRHQKKSEARSRGSTRACKCRKKSKHQTISTALFQILILHTSNLFLYLCDLYPSHCHTPRSKQKCLSKKFNSSLSPIRSKSISWSSVVSAANFLEQTRYIGPAKEGRCLPARQLYRILHYLHPPLNPRRSRRLQACYRR